ncbi:hypothetical protein JCM19037_3441 [Geomicrobium sp. JCM 19037]|uniref:hypothetical protein n=1 Tax=Geomicrobium sp. JCM 19037 TaxID=1460634 RepID=UPI00045F404F|nr:hypothetical protein [Geomicrobium sp. JCM 19037]GAK04980.1 hypothetical protein JCM19037_3441 [Geomicrobium sp. JCM 19037]
MWILLGFIAIIATLINLFMYKSGKNYTLAMALALSFTALTLCAEYSLVSEWVLAEDWAALLDVVPSMEPVLWVVTLVSIGLNITPALLDRRR